MRKRLVGFLVLAVTLALVQLYQLRNTIPPPDGIAYFEVADQIQQVGYARALPIHWSPLYPLYVLAGRSIAGGALDRELFRSAAGDALLLVTLCVTVGLAFRSIARLCWPETPAAGHAWLAYACGLSLFLSFALLRVGLRMPRRVGDDAGRRDALGVVSGPCARSGSALVRTRGRAERRRVSRARQSAALVAGGGPGGLRIGARRDARSPRPGIRGVLSGIVGAVCSPGVRAVVRARALHVRRDRKDRLRPVVRRGVRSRRSRVASPRERRRHPDLHRAAEPEFSRVLRHWPRV